MTNGTKNNPIVLNNSNNNKNNLNANKARLKNKYGTRKVLKVERNMLKNKAQNAKENRQLTEFKYNLAKPLKIKVSAEKVKEVKRGTDQEELRRRKAQDKRNLIKSLTTKVKWHPPRSLLQFGNLENNPATLRMLQERENSAYGKNTPEAERVKIYEGWFRQLKTLMKNKPINDLSALKYGWVNSVIAKMNAEKKAKDNAKVKEKANENARKVERKRERDEKKAKEKANENARKAERKRERDEKRKKKENEKREKNAIAGLKKLRKN